MRSLCLALVPALALARQNVNAASPVLYKAAIRPEQSSGAEGDLNVFVFPGFATYSIFLDLTSFTGKDPSTGSTCDLSQGLR
jgi:hypothetical protein